MRWITNHKPLPDSDQLPHVNIPLVRQWTLSFSHMMRFILDSKSGTFISEVPQPQQYTKEMTSDLYSVCLSFPIKLWGCDTPAPSAGEFHHLTWPPPAGKVGGESCPRTQQQWRMRRGLELATYQLQDKLLPPSCQRKHLAWSLFGPFLSWTVLNGFGGFSNCEVGWCSCQHGPQPEHVQMKRLPKSKWFHSLC